MNLDFIARVVRQRRALRSHERWSRSEINANRATALEPLPVRQWQIEQMDDALVVRIVPGQGAVDAQGIAAAIGRALAAAGAVPPPIRIDLVEAVTRTALGKAPLIKALRHA